MEDVIWISTAIPRRTVAVRMRSVDELSLPPMPGEFVMLVITFDPSLPHHRADEIEVAVINAGARCLLDAGGPGVEAWHGEFWDPALAWSRSAAMAIKHFFDASIVGVGVDVTTFVVLVLDAEDSGWREVVEATRAVLTDRPDWRLHAAARDGRLVDVRQAIADGWPLDEFDADLGHTPLHDACVHGHLDVIRALIEAGVDVDRHCEAKIGDTPLGRVADTCSLEVARLLIDAGADPTIPGWMGITALDHATMRKDAEGKAVAALLRGSASGRGK